MIDGATALLSGCAVFHSQPVGPCRIVSQSTFMERGLDMGQDAREFQVGINYPWIDYAWDFGDPPAAWVAPPQLAEWRAKKRSQIVEDFKSFRRMGLFAVRWF